MSKTPKYFVYIIRDYQWANGAIGKIGVTDNLKKRAKQYKLESLEVLETETCAKRVSLREQELQRIYGYPVDRKQYWKVKRMTKKRKK
jgi:hypothetical protein